MLIPLKESSIGLLKMQKSIVLVVYIEVMSPAMTKSKFLAIFLRYAKVQCFLFIIMLSDIIMSKWMCAHKSIFYSVL